MTTDTPTKHTPGPWKLHRLGMTEYDVVSDGPAHLGTFLGINAGAGAPRILHPDEQAEFDANIRLIGALPDLLAACLGIGAEGRDANKNGDLIIPSHIWDLVTQAIAKANPANGE